MIRVAFILANSASWTGGLIYLQNLVATVMALPDRQIEPVLITTPETSDADLINFSGIEILRTSLVHSGNISKALKKVSEMILGRHLALEMYLCHHKIDVLSHSGVLGPRSSLPVIAWLPDFQHIRMPEFFQPAELPLRDRAFARTVNWADTILISSEDAKADLARFAPQEIYKSRVLHFVAGMVRADDTRGAAFLEETYGIDEPYFYLPGQFWKHKNQRLVIDALSLLAKEGIAPLVVSTGQTADRRNPNHFSELMAYAEAIGAARYFKVLGLVPYDHLSVLSRGAVALINPSHFEGWSTTVEEAKSMGKAIILSDIPVHREQSPERGIYVPADNAAAMAQALQELVASWSREEDDRSISAASAALSTRSRAFGNAYQQIILEATDRDDSVAGHRA